MRCTEKILPVLVAPAVLVLIAAATLRAVDDRKGSDNWDNLKQLASGEQVQVVLKDAKSYRGQFQTVSDEAIVVRLAAGDQAFERARVMRISAIGKSRRGRNALIGAAIGGGLGGVAVGMDCHYGRKGCGAGGVAAGVPFGAALCAGIAALIPTGGWHDVYRAR
jgi:hypothetical protein